MREILIIVAAILVFSACGSKNKQGQEAESPVDEISQIAKGIDDGHNAQNSLDFEGTYSGKLPTASGTGMNVTITLEGNTFVRVTEYVGKEGSKVEETGTYTWNEAGNTITLVGANKPNQYFVGENTLTQLDMEGQRITGEMAGLYVLRK